MDIDQVIIRNCDFLFDDVEDNEFRGTHRFWWRWREDKNNKKFALSGSVYKFKNGQHQYIVDEFEKDIEKWQEYFIKNGVTINYLKEDINFTDFSTKYTNICINTSCEHMLPMDSISFQNDDNVLYVLQSNDMKNIREHVNCVDSNEEFIKQASLSRTYYHGKKRLEAQNKKKYWRFMIIGRRDD